MESHVSSEYSLLRSPEHQEDSLVGIPAENGNELDLSSILAKPSTQLDPLMLTRAIDQLVSQLAAEKELTQHLQTENLVLKERIRQFQKILDDHTPRCEDVDLWSTEDPVPEPTECQTIVERLLDSWKSVERKGSSCTSGDTFVDDVVRDEFVDLSEGNLKDLVGYTVTELARCKDAMQQLRESLQEAASRGSESDTVRMHVSVHACADACSRCASLISHREADMENIAAQQQQPTSAMSNSDAVNNAELEQLSAWLSAPSSMVDRIVGHVPPPPPYDFRETEVKRPISMELAPEQTVVRPQHSNVMEPVRQTQQPADVQPRVFPLLLDQDERRACPVCAITFAASVPQETFEQHVQAHFDEPPQQSTRIPPPTGRTCPVCNNLFPENDFTQNEYELHVYEHMDSMGRPSNDYEFAHHYNY